MASLKGLALSLLLLQPCVASFAEGWLARRRIEQAARLGSLATEQGDKNSTCTSTSCYRYYNSKTKPYLIESLPDVEYEIGEMYGGNVPIDSSDPSRTLYFIFQPSQGPPIKELTIWLNGGPGCSSLEGFLQENGPFLWLPGTSKPVKNHFAWSDLTNMIWVEQPVGVGFSTGKVEAANEVDLAKEFLGFFKNFQELFGIKNYKIYVTGESYAGRYVPYISAQMLDEKDDTYFNLQGALMYDPQIGNYQLQTVYPLYDFVLNNQEILNSHPSVLLKMEEASRKCGIQAYMDKYLTFPPPGHQPTTRSGGCDLYSLFFDATETNFCLNPYNIANTCPSPSNVLYSHPYFNRADVKKAINAPLNVTWTMCTNEAVFLHDGLDPSPDPIQATLPQVIEATNRVLIANADWDSIYPNNGTLLSIQNMTWNGKTGFQSAPKGALVVPMIPGKGYTKQGLMGTQHYERGLQWATTAQCGHMQPLFQPIVSYLHLQWLLGRIENLPGTAN